MRTIKFRAWDKKNKLMYEVYEFHNAIPYKSSCVLGQRKEEDKEGKTIYPTSPTMTLEECEIMQYTGLKDKNGKEIYEGDIVEYTDISGSGQERVFPPREVRWDKEMCEFTVSETEEDATYEVIGNIYENKDLLND